MQIHINNNAETISINRTGFQSLTIAVMPDPSEAVTE